MIITGCPERQLPENACCGGRHDDSRDAISLDQRRADLLAVGNVVEAALAAAVKSSARQKFV